MSKETGGEEGGVFLETGPKHDDGSESLRQGVLVAYCSEKS